MKAALCLLVLIALTMATTTVEAGWFRLRRVATAAAIAAALGKRDVAGLDNANEAQAEVAAELAAKCSKLPEDPAEMGLTSSRVNQLLTICDKDGDLTLKGSELDSFAKIIGTYDLCEQFDEI